MTYFQLFTHAGRDAAPVAAPSSAGMAQLVALRQRLELDLGVRVQLQFGHVAPAVRQEPALLAA